MLYKRTLNYLNQAGYLRNTYLADTFKSLIRIKKPEIILLILENIANISADADLIDECLASIRQPKDNISKGTSNDADIYSYISISSRKAYLGLVSRYQNHKGLMYLEQIYSNNSQLQLQFHARVGRLLNFHYSDKALEIASSIAERQMNDGGWIHSDDKRDNLESCIWTTLEVILLLQETDAETFKDAIHIAHKNVKSRLLKQNSSSGILTGTSAWDELSIGNKDQSMFAGGTLKYLESLSLLMDEDSKDLRKHLNWLRSIRLTNNLFPRNIKGKQIPDPYVSVRALKVLHNYHKSRL